MWYYFGAHAVFVTFRLFNEWSFRVCIYTTSKEYTIPSIDYIEDEAEYLFDFNMRGKLRVKYTGACALEYESVIQVVLEVLLACYDHTYKGTHGIFVEGEAYGGSGEEHACFTLHSHIPLWIKDFNKVQYLLFHHDGTVFDDTKVELEKLLWYGITSKLWRSKSKTV